MARRGLRQALRAALRQVRQTQRPASRDDVRVSSDGGYHDVSLLVRPISGQGIEGDHVMVVFEKRPERATAPAQSEQRAPSEDDANAIRRLEVELEATRSELQSTIEKAEASNEELKSSNEELVSMNEELQSTVEELDTAKEEAQSVNEELETVNEELNAKVEELRRTHVELQSVYSNIQVPTLFLDSELCIKNYTPPMVELCKLIPGDIGRPIDDMAARHDYEYLSDDVREVIRTLVPKEREVHSPDGRAWVMSVAPFRTPEDKIEGVVITFFDVSKLLQARREIERLNRDLAFQLAELETTLELVPVGVVICEDPAGERMRLNRRGVDLLGLEEATLGKKGLEAENAQFRFERDGQRLAVAQHPLQRALAHGQPVQDETLSVRRADGTRTDLIVSAAPLFGQNDRIRGAVAAFTDITTQIDEQRNLSARNVEQTAIADLGFHAVSESDVQEFLERAVERVASVLETELVGVFELQPKRQELLLKAGRGWREGQLGRMLAPADARSPAGRALQAGEPVSFSRLETDGRFSNPEHLTAHGVEAGVEVLVPGRERPFGVLAAYSTRERRFSQDDVDFLRSVGYLVSAALQRARGERELAESRYRLALADTEKAIGRAERLASLGTLAAAITHEINNPLNAIMVNAELGLKRFDKEGQVEKVRDALHTIVEEVKRCSAITRDVLQLSRDHDTPKELGDLNEVVGRAREFMRAHFQMNDVAIHLETEDVALVRLNATGMERALINVLRNAAEAGGHGVNIRIRTAQAEGSVILTISDDGPGIAAEDVDKIFDPFFSARRDQTGTGLGLNLVKQAVTDHGGAIDVESEVGRGTTFTIRLPVPAPQENARA